MRVLEVEELRKVYGDVVANDGITLSVGEGDVCAVLGPNGAGKTTLVRQIIGLTHPDAGRALVDGIDVSHRPSEVRKRCALQPQGALAINGLTARQAIALAGTLRGVARKSAIRVGDALLEELDITAWANTRLTATSGGVGRLVMFCMAVVAPSRLLMLDEPTNDVDPLRRHRLWTIVRRLADEQGSAVLLVTHNVAEAERAVDRVAIINRGCVVAAGTPASLRGPDARLNLQYRLRGATPPEPSRFDPGTRRGTRCVTAINADAASSAIEWARRQLVAGTIEDFSLGPQTLEDTYLELIDHTPETADVAL